jgi:hypothetical protein
VAFGGTSGGVLPVLGITPGRESDRGLIMRRGGTPSDRVRQVRTGNPIDGRFDAHGRYRGPMVDGGGVGRTTRELDLSTGAGVDLLHRPRLYVGAVAAVAIAASAWLLLVPITAVYVTSADDPAPHEVSTRYAWWTTEQNFLYSDAGLAPRAHTVNGVRLNCGNAFTTGSGEGAPAAAGPRACAMVETPRCIVGLALFTVALLGLLGTTLLPAAGDNSGNRYRQPRGQRRALKRGG